MGVGRKAVGTGNHGMCQNHRYADITENSQNTEEGAGVLKIIAAAQSLL